MATNPVGSWLTGGGVTGRGGAPGPVAKAAGANPLIQQLQTNAPIGGWGDMGMQKENVAALTPFTPPAKTMPSGPPPIAEMMKAAGPSPMAANIAQAMASRGPEPSSYSDPYEAAKQARLSGRPSPAAPAPAPQAAAPPPPPAAAVQPPMGPQPSIAQNMGAATAPNLAAAMRPAGPQFSDPYEAAKQARLGGRGR